MSAKRPRPPKKFKIYEKHGNNEAGYGSFGHVYFYHLIENHSQLYAVKAIPGDEVRKDEIDILKECSHKNIVSYIDCDYQDSLWLIVTELLNSSLYDALRAAEKSLFMLTQYSKGVRLNQIRFLPKLNEYEMFSIADNCFEGLMYLHSKDIIHPDIYPPNILLEVRTVDNIRSITAKICDFGLSKHGSNGHQTNLQNVYSAPETNIKSDEGYSLKADVFSLGVVIAEMIYDLAGVKKGLFNEKFVGNIRNEWRGIVTQGTKYSKEATKYARAVDVVMPMTSEDPKKRSDIQGANLAWNKFRSQTTDDDNIYDDATFGESNQHQEEKDAMDGSGEKTIPAGLCTVFNMDGSGEKTIPAGLSTEESLDNMDGSGEKTIPAGLSTEESLDNMDGSGEKTIPAALSREDLFNQCLLINPKITKAAFNRLLNIE